MSNNGQGWIVQGPVGHEEALDFILNEMGASRRLNTGEWQDVLKRKILALDEERTAGAEEWKQGDQLQGVAGVLPMETLLLLPVHIHKVGEGPSNLPPQAHYESRSRRRSGRGL